MIVVCVTACVADYLCGGGGGIVVCVTAYVADYRCEWMVVCVIGLGPDHRLFDSCQSDRPVRQKLSVLRNSRLCDRPVWPGYLTLSVGNCAYLWSHSVDWSLLPKVPFPPIPVFLLVFPEFSC